MRYILHLALILLLLGACSGEDDAFKDKTPPSKPVLIPHLGDTGDAPIMIDENVMMEITDDNNGLDAVPDGHKLRLMWEPFIDTDLSHLKIFRFSDVDTTVVEIANIQPNTTQYTDNGPLVEREWYSYFVKLFDTSGNSAVSDTVTYSLLAKASLIAPVDGAFVSTDNLRFYWNRADDRVGFYRVLLWNESNELLWHGDKYLATEDDPLWLQLPILTPPIPVGRTLRWRVDYFDWSEEHQMYMGSESEERIFTTI